MLTIEERAAVADALRTAEHDRAPIEPLTSTWPDIEVTDSYQIQAHNIGRRLAESGGAVLGYKIGLSSLMVQRQFGVSQPDYGHLITDMRIADGATVSAGRYCYPRVELEIGFLLGGDLPGPDATGADVSAADVLAATAALVPAIELVDSRIVDWRIGLPDTVADNASAAGFVLGAARVPPADLDPKAIDTVLFQDGIEVAAGRSDTVLGDPAIAVAWLANALAAAGTSLRAGQIVLPGSCVRPFGIAAGRSYRGEFTGLGGISLSFD